MVEIMLKCNVLCLHETDFDGQTPLEEWLPFALVSLETLAAFKVAGPFVDKLLGDKPESKCTTVYLTNGETFILDIHFNSLLKITEQWLQTPQ